MIYPINGIQSYILLYILFQTIEAMYFTLLCIEIKSVIKVETFILHYDLNCSK